MGILGKKILGLVIVLACLQCANKNNDTDTTGDPSLTGSADVQIKITGANGSSDYIFEVDGTVVTSANDPTLNLQAGKRYAVVNAVSTGHPFGLYSGATKLLSQSGTGSLESDSGINWQESGNTVAFTVTTGLKGQLNKYQCEIHTSTMTGSISIP